MGTTHNALLYFDKAKKEVRKMKNKQKEDKKRDEK